MKIPACPPKPWRRWARILSNILLGLLFLHLASSPAFAQCDVTPCTDTAIGCIPIDLGAATGCFFGLVVEIIGLLALIMFAAGGYQAMTAGDNPDALQEGKAKMTAAITGFFFLLLFVKIITMIGVNILGITPLCHVLGNCP